MNEIILYQQANVTWYVCEKGLKIWATTIFCVYTNKSIFIPLCKKLLIIIVIKGSKILIFSEMIYPNQFQAQNIF